MMTALHLVSSVREVKEPSNVSALYMMMMNKQDSGLSLSSVSESPHSAHFLYADDDDVSPLHGPVICALCR